MTNNNTKNKQEFLQAIKEYLMNGGVVYSQNKWCDETDNFKKLERTEEEALLILNNKELLKDVDVLKDELDYFGLELADVI